jgi:ATP-dependent DNA helicase RecG
MGTDPAQLTFSFPDAGALTVEEVWNRASPDLLQRLGEDRRVERKPAGIHATELATYFSMWANTADGGLIVVGMENDGTITGCTNVSAKLEMHASDQCPDARVECRQIPATRLDGTPDYLLLFRVMYNRRRVVRTAAGDAYIRIGESRRKLRSEEIRDLEVDKGQLDIEQEAVTSLRFPDDFNASLVEEFITSVRARTSYPARLSTADILELRHLGRRKGAGFVPNAACVLLFANDPVGAFPGCKIRFLRHQGEAEGTGVKWNVVKDLIVEGPIPLLIQGAGQILSQQLREFSRLGADGRFAAPAPEYPMEAWYEAVVNACVHRSYGALRNMNIFIRMFDDRLEIESPGGFPPPVTADNIYEMHQPRNPHLMDAMMYLNYVKCAREGTRRMRQSMTAADLPVPVFVQKESTYSLVRVTLRNDIKQRTAWVDADAAHVIGAELARDLTRAEVRAVNFIAENGKGHASEVARLLNIDWQTARRMLARLVGKGVLQHVHRKDILRDPRAHFIIAVRANSSSGLKEGSSSN